MTEQDYLKEIAEQVKREEVTAKLKLHSAGSLSTLMDIAQLIDERNTIVLRNGRVNNPTTRNLYGNLPNPRNI